jgi:hypothetical protein
LTDCRAGHSANNNNSTNHNNNNNTNMIAIITNLICAMLHWALTVLAMVPRLCYTAGLWVSAAQAASDRRQRVWEGQWRQREAARLRAEREAAQAEEYWRLQLASGQQQRERPTGESQFEVSKALALVFVQGSNKPSRSHDDRESDPTRRRYISISYDANLKCSHYSTLSFHLNQWGPLKAFGSPRMLIWPPTGTPNLLRAARPLPGGYALSTKLCKRRSGGASASSWPRTGGRGATASLRGPIRHRYFDSLVLARMQTHGARQAARHSTNRCLPHQYKPNQVHYHRAEEPATGHQLRSQLTAPQHTAQLSSRLRARPRPCAP